MSKREALTLAADGARTERAAVLDLMARAGWSKSQARRADRLRGVARGLERRACR